MTAPAVVEALVEARCANCGGAPCLWGDEPCRYDPERPLQRFAWDEWLRLSAAKQPKLGEPVG